MTNLGTLSYQASDRVRDAVMGQRRMDAQMQIAGDQFRMGEATKRYVADAGVRAATATAGGQTEAARIKALHDFLGNVASAGAQVQAAQATAQAAGQADARRVTPVAGGYVQNGQFVPAQQQPTPQLQTQTDAAGNQYYWTGDRWQIVQPLDAMMPPGAPGATAPAAAAPATQMSAQDQAAMAWARANPNDPRSAQILSRLGAR